ncbi:LMxysn_1693 family intestinal colonization protein [Enterococcus faecalis]|uniref:LMxysn_1693 family intestinal colonization protein n=1 Tax=Enterococcus faecalis TaxID=1351 RepID=UPI003C12C64D
MSSQNVHAAEESINSDGNVQVKFEIEDDEYYYVFDSGNEVPSLARTWSQASCWSIVRGTRTYLGTETHKRGITLSATVPVGPVSVKAEATYSASGKFRKYRQYARITVRYIMFIERSIIDM